MPTASSPASTSSPKSTASAPAVWKSCARWFVSKTGGTRLRRRRRGATARRASGAGRVDELGRDRGGHLVADRQSGRVDLHGGEGVWRFSLARRQVCSAFCFGAPPPEARGRGPSAWASSPLVS